MGTIVDLFCGCGGFSLGAELAGFRSLAAIDIESKLQSAYRANFREANAITADVMDLDKSTWHRLLGKQKPDGLIGGPPCQGFSVIGKRDLNDPRNSLIGQFFRHVALLQPKFFIMENVEGLLAEETRPFLESAMNELSGNYTVFEPFIVAAPNFGAPTRRRRVVVVGIDSSELGSFVQKDFEGNGASFRVNVKDAIADLPRPIAQGTGNEALTWARYPRIRSDKISSYARLMRSPPPLSLASDESRARYRQGLVSGLAETKHSPAIAARYAGIAGGKVDPITKSYRLEWNGIAPTLRAGTGAEKGSFQAVRPLHPSEGRVITVREAARLQGFPDWFTFHPTKWHSFRMIGNSVSPMVAFGILSPFAERLAFQTAA